MVWIELFGEILDIFSSIFGLKLNGTIVMDMGWDYQYYQPWSDNEWLLQEVINNDIATEKEGEYNNES